jgi:hypothetical protein
VPLQARLDFDWQEACRRIANICGLLPPPSPPAPAINIA